MSNLFQLDTATILGLSINLVAALGGALLSRAHWPQWITGIATLFVSSVIPPSVKSSTVWVSAELVAVRKSLLPPYCAVME